MSTLIQDIRYSIRSLLRQPGFTCVALLTLALGIGVNSAIFSIVNAYLFKPFPARDPNQLTVIATRDKTIEVPYEMSYPNYEEIRDRSDVFADLIAYQSGVANLSLDGQAERIWVEAVTGNYFSMLGVEAAVGRTFTPEEGRLAGAHPVAVLSHGYWQRRFGGDPSAVGKAIKLNSIPFTIIGVAPQSFTGTENVLAMELYIPLGMDEQMYPSSKGWLKKRDDTGIRVMARLKPGVSLEQAQAAVTLVAGQLEQEYPQTNKGVGFLVAWERNARPIISIAENVPRIAAVFMALVGLVLLIACANVANLMLAHATTREKELAIRAAMGASRGRLIRLLLTEGVAVALAGGGMGLLLALWGVDWLASIRLSTDIPIRFDLSPDWRVFAFALLAAVLTGVLSALAPALHASKLDLNESLKEGGRSSTAGSARHRVRNLLVVSQVAVSLMVLICAGLFVQSSKSAENIDLGFRTENLMMMSMDIGMQGYEKGPGVHFYRQLKDNVKSLPGVRSVALARDTPLGYNNHGEEIFLEGRTPDPQSERTTSFFNVVDTGYFQTMGMSIVEGRDFTEQDNESAPPVLIINEALARRYWPGSNPIEDAIGKRLRVGRDAPLALVIGVARDSKYMFLGEEARSFLYLPLAQNYRSEITLFVHSEADPNGLAAAMREAVRELDQDLPLYDVKTMSSHLRGGLALLFVRLGATLASTFGLLGLVLAVVGIYGVISYSVSQRRHEIGIRMALGAQAGDVLKLVLGHGVTLTAVGVGVGMLGAFATTRVLSSLLYGVSATDTATFVAVPLILSGVALAASFVPARRAAKVDPMVALRGE
jgi:predicted permease